MANSVIISAARTPIGSFQGGLSSMSGPQLGSVALKAAAERAEIDFSLIEAVNMGCVLSAGLGQAPARQAALGAGIPVTSNVMTINKVCGSGLQAVVLADQAIRCGDAEVILAGGMESMSNAPYLLPQARSGLRLGNGDLIDSMIHDGLWDPYQDFHMGCAGELCASKFGIDRAAQDAFAQASYRKAQAAIAEGKFAEEIAPVEVRSRRGPSVMVEVDEEPSRINWDKFTKLRPAFAKEGTITAGNASSISDGAAALTIMSEKKARALGCRPWARIVAHACASQDPKWFTTAPAEAIKKVCERADCRIEDIDLFEINEAFACVPLYAAKVCGLDLDRVNVCGGAIAMGHPLGASGARVLVTLLHALRNRGKSRGLATLCNGGGEAVAMIIEMTE